MSKTIFKYLSVFYFDLELAFAVFFDIVNIFFRCKATNHILNVIKYSRTALLTVSPPLTGAIPPSFLPLDISPNITAYVGENLNLYCAVMGWPIPTVQWLNSKYRQSIRKNLYSIFFLFVFSNILSLYLFRYFFYYGSVVPKH